MYRAFGPISTKIEMVGLFSFAFGECLQCITSTLWRNAPITAHSIGSDEPQPGVFFLVWFVSNGGTGKKQPHKMNCLWAQMPHMLIYGSLNK